MLLIEYLDDFYMDRYINLVNIIYLHDQQNWVGLV